MALDERLVAETLAASVAAQRGHAGIESSGPASPVKVAAKQRAAELIAAVSERGDCVMEIGAEGNYRHLLDALGLAVEPVNLPDDMHEISAVGEYDGAIAMHVLEHSPFPLYVLRALYRAVRPGGWLYAAVPHVTDKWARDTAHFSVLHPDAWAYLLDVAGWNVLVRESGKLAKRASAVEERFLCERRAD